MNLDKLILTNLLVRAVSISFKSLLCPLLISLMIWQIFL